MAAPSPSNNLELHVASEDALDVRQFAWHERLSGITSVEVTALCQNADIDFDAVVGRPASFTIRTDGQYPPRVFTGLVSRMEQLIAEQAAAGGRAASTYRLHLVPTLWLLTQRRNYRIFQRLSEPAIVQKLLGEWDIEPEVRLDLGGYKKRKYRVQYGESDYAFVCRMLEDAGITFFFEIAGDETKLVLADAPQKAPPREPKLLFHDAPSQAVARREYVTAVRVGQQVRPGKYVMRDHDYRRAPTNQPLAVATSKNAAEHKMERVHFVPGAFLHEKAEGGDTPTADDKGSYRADDETVSKDLATRRLDAKRGRWKVISLETNALDLAPGMVFSMLSHPRTDLGEDKKLLVVESVLAGSASGAFQHRCEARSADLAFRPPLATPKPKIAGVESATVVGPAGEEIHTDEFGRIRVHFHWDRESKMNDDSSCWIHVSQPWGGSGYGGMNLPRVGQEVIVDFLGGDPDRPIVTGRVYTNLQKVPYGLPANKTKSSWKSNSTNKTGGSNEITFEDKAGSEEVFLHAERDRRSVTKRDSTTTVGKDRSITVEQNDTETVKGTQKIRVLGDQKLGVSGKREIEVGKSQHVIVHQDSTDDTVLTRTSNAKDHQIVSVDHCAVDAGQGISLRVGSSVIYIDQHKIIIQAGRVFVNPD
jgi:type VI secretion system secreted protein VgrG